MIKFDRLEAIGVELLADVKAPLGEIVLIQTDLLAAPRSVVGVFHTAVWVFPIVALALLGVAVLIDRDRFRPIQWFGLTAAAAMLASLAGLRGAVNVAGSTIESDVDRAAADAIWTALLDGYVRINAIVGFAVLVIGLAALWWRHWGQTQAARHISQATSHHQS